MRIRPLGIPVVERNLRDVAQVDRAAPVLRDDGVAHLIEPREIAHRAHRVAALALVDPSRLGVLVLAPQGFSQCGNRDSARAHGGVIERDAHLPVLAAEHPYLSHALHALELGADDGVSLHADIVDGEFGFDDHPGNRVFRIGIEGADGGAIRIIGQVADESQFFRDVEAGHVLVHIPVELEDDAAIYPPRCARSSG